jgi:hypothetical protein
VSDEYLVEFLTPLATNFSPSTDSHAGCDEIAGQITMPGAALAAGVAGFTCDRQELSARPLTEDGHQ